MHLLYIDEQSTHINENNCHDIACSMNPTLANKIKLLLVLHLMIISLSYGQSKRAWHWYFGWQAGISFNNGIAQSDTTGKLISIEGSSSISDTAGNLLFYSNGETVWNKNNSVMPNGTGLLGDQSSVQSSIIVPMPGNNSIYYLFTTNGSLGSGLRYHIIDMSLNGGLGDLISKNILLLSPGTEELAGTIHCNNNDYWIIAREVIKDTLKFYAYLLNTHGINKPIITDFNVSTPDWNNVGSLTFSQDGKLLSFTSFGSDTYLFGFDKGTGQLTILDQIARYNNENVYSNAISPDNKKLYTTSWVAGGFNYLSQFDLTATNISASRINIDSTDYSNGSPNGYGLIGQLKIAPDQKIYVSRWNQNDPFHVNPETYYSLDSLDAINFPDLEGLACKFQRNYLYLHHKPTMIGLPNFISNFTNPVLLSQICKVADTTNKDTTNNDTTNNFVIDIFPNPFHQHVYVKTNLIDKSKLTVRLMDMWGRIIKTSTHITADGLEIRCGFLARAMYVIQVFNSQDEVAIKKMMAY